MTRQSSHVDHRAEFFWREDGNQSPSALGTEFVRETVPEFVNGPIESWIAYHSPHGLWRRFVSIDDVGGHSNRMILLAKCFMAQDLTEKILKLVPKNTSTILSAMFFVATLLVNYGASRTHISDVQAQQEKRLDSIEAQIKNDLATRREVDEVKSTVNRIEDKLDQALSTQSKPENLPRRH